VAECEYEHIQDAINDVTERGSRILVLPGLYREEPSLADPPAGCEEHYEATENADRSGYLMEYDEQLACPHAQNLIAVLGDPDDSGVGNCGPLCDLQIEGTGEHATDVVVDADYSKLNGIRADRANGFGLFNLTAQRTEFNAVYILEQDGFVIDNVLTRWNYEYGFLTFSADNGLYKDCEAYGSGDAGLYPGSAADIHADQEDHDSLEPDRYATLIQNCVSHHNALGYSGTAGNSIHMYDSQMVLNGIGITTDSLFPDHPGFPQDHARWENNTIANNNINYYDFYDSGHCDEDVPYAERGFEHGTVCPNVPTPVGTAAMIAGGNWNLIRGNDIYDNWRYGGMQFSVPSLLREETAPNRQFDTSHNNHWVDNNMGLSPDGHFQPTRTDPMGRAGDFWWDDQGEGNCWQGNERRDGGVTSNMPHITQPQAQMGLPDCDSGGSVAPPEPIAIPNAAKSGQIASCATFDRYDNPRPCYWMDDPEIPAEREPATTAVGRHAGDDRVGTAIALSRHVHHMTGEMAGMSHNVVIARADDYADALVAAPLARRLNAPVLLTRGDRLDTRVTAELRRLNARRAFVMGGTSALSANVAQGLAAAGVTDVQRVAGADRFDTAAQVARLLGGSQAYLAKGVDSDVNRAWPDAVAVSGLAASQMRPILLTRGNALPDATRDVIEHLGIRNLTIVGGEAAISADVASTVEDLVPYPERVGGENRYETSALLADRSEINTMDPNQVWLVTGRNWPDALAAGASAGYVGSILLLVDGRAESLEGHSGEWLDGRYFPSDEIHLIGGTSALSQGIQDSLAGESADDGDEEAPEDGEEGNGSPLPFP
jgi:putative cell wall-binding protein